MSQSSVNLGESKLVLWLKGRFKVSKGFWLRTRETAVVLILIAVAKIAIRGICLLEDFVQSFCPLAEFEG